MSSVRWLRRGALGSTVALACAGAGASFATGPDSPAAPRSIRLEAKALRDFDVRLPAEHFREIGSGFDVPHQGGDRFSAVVEGERMRADLDGNGELEAIVEGETAFLTFTGQSPEGRALAYSVRLVHPKGKSWTYSCGGAMAGEIEGTRVLLFDQDLNGSFADFGVDAMVVGKDSAASFLSRIVSIGGSLWSIDVERDGSALRYTPYAGESGTLDLVSNFESKAKLEAAIVVGADGKTSFSVAKAKGGLVVPAGEYRLQCGALALGDAKASFSTGRSSPIQVGAAETKTVAWGGPAKAEFGYTLADGQLAFTPWDIWYYGALGEEYVNFLPLGKSPDFVVKNRATGEDIAAAKFPGNCCSFGFAPVAVTVPAKIPAADLEIRMTAENWAFGEIHGEPRRTTGLSERPAGTEKPATPD